MANTNKVGRGRPQKYPLTARQIGKIQTRLAKGLSAAFIADELGVHEFAVLRVRRAL